jgi:hypothetical protein
MKKLIPAYRQLKKASVPTVNSQQQPQNSGTTIVKQKLKAKSGLCHLTSTWMIGNRAGIRVTREELAALAIITGMVFTWQDRLLYLTAYGGFGFSLDLSHAGAAWSVALVQGSRLPRNASSLGTGYTTLMAKHLACGSIPFAQNEDWVVTIYVTNDVLAAIKRGGNIIDRRAFGGDSLEFLRRLPSSKLIDAFYGVYTEDTAGSPQHPSFGAILHANGTTELGTWTGAVTRIAFGGLVPQACPNVVEAVRFTVDGGMGEDLGVCIEALESLVDELHQQEADSELFGDNVTGAAKGHSYVNYTFPSEHNNSPDAAAVFARYSNLLERLIAIVVEKRMSNGPTSSDVPPQTQGTPTANGQSESDDEIIDSIIEATNQQLWESYTAAVNRTKGNGSTVQESTLKKLVQQVTDKVKQGSVLELTDVAVIIRCVLASWAFTVPLIKVKQTPDMQGAAPWSGCAPITKVIHEIVLSSLPPVSAFC